MNTALYNEALSTYQRLQLDIAAAEDISKFNEILKKTNRIFLNLPESNNDDSIPGSDVRKFMQDRFYGDICNVILNSFNNTWLKESRISVTEEVNKLFINSPGKDVLFILTSKFHEKGCHSFVLEEAKRLLILLVSSKQFPELLCNECKIVAPSTDKMTSGKSKNRKEFYDEKLVTILCSIPDRVANKMRLERESILYPCRYFTQITEGVCIAMEYVHSRLSTGQDSSLVFLSRLFAKVCALNHANEAYDVLLPRIEKWIKISPLWSRICSYLFMECPDLHLEVVLEPLLTRKLQVQTLTTLLTNSVVNNSKLKFLLTHKYLLVRVYSTDIVPLNIFSYLESNRETRGLIMDTFVRLLEVWSDKYTLTSTSVDQHYYISRCISSLVYFMRKEEVTEKKSVIMKCLLNGMSAHLESPIERIRIIGMTVAEIITKKLDGKEKSLKFDFERVEESQHLEKLSIDPHETICNSENLNDVRNEVYSEVSPAKQTRAARTAVDSSNLDIDSDDDFEPYNVDDADEEFVVNGIRPPLYIRDCISGLLSKDDPNRLEASLKVSESLIWKESNDLEDIAVELTKILLYLDDQYGLSGYTELRFNSLVAICCKCPKTVSSYITREFYAENYNIRQRLDILEVLSTSASFLSTPGKTQLPPKKDGLLLPKVMYPKSVSTNDWKTVIEERLKKKTRILSKGRQPKTEPSQNQFADCAGYFFFPLLKYYDSTQLTFDLLGQDSFLLGRLLYAAGSILHCGTGLLITGQMASSAFEIIWGLRFHKEPFVRQSLIYLFCMVLVSCNPNVIISDFSKEIFEGKEWLEDLLKVDTDKECQKLAAHCLVILQSIVKTAIIQ